MKLDARRSTLGAAASVWIACAAWAAAGCGSGDDNAVPAPVVPTDASAVADAAVHDATTTPTKDASPPAMAYVRLAQWSLDTPPIDFCLAPAGSRAFHGPLLSTVFQSPTDGGVLGVAFQQASAYVTTPPGQFDVRFVAAGSADCAAPLAPDFAGWTLSNGSRSTLAAVGSASVASGATGALHILPMSDDAVAPLVAMNSSAQRAVALRFVHADPYAGRVSLTTALFGPLFQSVPFSAVSSSDAGATPTISVDTDGYALLVAQAALDTWSVTSMDGGALLASLRPSVAAGAVITTALVPPILPDASTPDASYLPAQLVECIDSAGTVAPVGNCTVSPLSY
jgi:hypothetical protein